MLIPVHFMFGNIAGKKKKKKICKFRHLLIPSIQINDNTSISFLKKLAVISLYTCMNVFILIVIPP